MGRMGWAPDVAMKADPILITLAWKGHCEELEQLERMMFAANGNPLPPKDPSFGKGSMASRMREFASAHNAGRKKREPPKKAARRDG